MILAFFLIGLFILVCLSAYGWRRKALHNAKEAQGMALLAAHLEGQLTQSQATTDKMTEIAKHAINEAAKAAQLKPEDVWTHHDLPSLDTPMPKRRHYVAQTVAYCPSCNVSVRHDPADYPVKCPREGCDALIDPTFDSGIVD